jgi:hypothetical protein
MFDHVAMKKGMILDTSGYGYTSASSGLNCHGKIHFLDVKFFGPAEDLNSIKF